MLLFRYKPSVGLCLVRELRCKCLIAVVAHAVKVSAAARCPARRRFGDYPRDGVQVAHRTRPALRRSWRYTTVLARMHVRVVSNWLRRRRLGLRTVVHRMLARWEFKVGTHSTTHSTGIPSMASRSWCEVGRDSAWPAPWRLDRRRLAIFSWDARRSERFV
jgi:hypothetical protein